MALPSELQLGSHRLKLLTVSRNAEDVADARRCSDSALTAFCFVGELQSASAGGTIAWYYSPLYQFERKKIRVEGSVIEAALSAAATQQQQQTGGCTTSNTTAAGVKAVKAEEDETAAPHVFLDAAFVLSAASNATTDDNDTAEEEEDGAVAAKPLPGIFIRLGNSSTFREYKLVAAEPNVMVADGTSASTGMPAMTTTAGVPTALSDDTRNVTMADGRVITAPMLKPVAPKRPSLKPIDTRFGSFTLRRPQLRRESSRQFIDASPTDSPASRHTGAPSAMPMHESDDEDAMNNHDSVESDMSAATAPVGLHSPHITPNAQNSLQLISSCLYATPDPVAPRKGTPNAATASSASSAFLSNSNFLSGRVSRLPNGPASASRSPGMEMDVRPLSSNGVVCASGRISEDAQALLRDPLAVSSALGTPISPASSTPAPPSSQRPHTARRPQLRPHSGRVYSGRLGRGFGAADPQLELDAARAATPPVMY